MTRLILTLFTLMPLFSTQCLARCVYAPRIQADVRTWSCIPATFGAGGSAFYNYGPLYKSGSTHSGTLIGIEVTNSHFVWNAGEPHRSNGARLWQRGDQRILFVDATATTTCPKSLPSTMTVVEVEKCCDVMPMSG